LKLPLLLAQYLYQQKKLTLPGIGTFVIESSQPTSNSEEKSHSSTAPVRFQESNEKEFAPELIDYIRLQTGKMKTLAHADLNSYLNDIKEFINFGKPCYLEGIGTITKNRDNSYTFVPGETISTPGKPEQKFVMSEKPVALHENEYYTETPTRSTARNLLVMFAAIAGLALIGWGGYFFYSRYQAEQVSSMTVSADTSDNQNLQPEINPADSLQVNSDSGTTLSVSGSSSGSSAQGWNFILRRGSPAAAKKRYEQLKSYGIPVQLTVVDSTTAKVFLTLDVPVTDTARVRDSLRIYYAAPVSIERP